MSYLTGEGNLNVILFYLIGAIVGCCCFSVFKIEFKLIFRNLYFGREFKISELAAIEVTAVSGCGNMESLQTCSLEISRSTLP